MAPASLLSHVPLPSSWWGTWITHRGTVEPCQTEAPGLTGETAGQGIRERGTYRVTAASESLNSNSHVESLVIKGLFKITRVLGQSAVTKDVIRRLVQPLFKNFNIVRKHRQASWKKSTYLILQNCLVLYVCLHVCAMVSVWRSEDSLQKISATKWDVEIELGSSPFACWAISPVQKIVMLSKESYSKVICISKSFLFI